MKQRKLLIPTRCTTRKIYPHRPPTGRNDWQVLFTPPAVNGVRRVVFRSTRTKEIAAAKRIAAQIIESFWTDSVRGAEPLKLCNDNATIAESGPNRSELRQAIKDTAAEKDAAPTFQKVKECSEASN